MLVKKKELTQQQYLQRLYFNNFPYNTNKWIFTIMDIFNTLGLETIL